MRNLTIKWRRMHVNGIDPVTFYIEDKDGDIDIGRTKCKVLGTMENGEEKSFPIQNTGLWLYAVTGKGGVKHGCEFYFIKEGTESISLSGHGHKSISGITFRFDSNPVQEKKEKKSRKVATGIVICICVLLIALTALAPTAIRWYNNYTRTHSHSTSPTTQQDEAKEEYKTYESNGLSITMPEGFVEKSLSGQTVYLESDDISMAALKEPFTQLDNLSELTVEEYGEKVLEINEMDKGLLTSYNSIPGYEYDRVNGEEEYHYRAYLYKTDDSFWMVQFATKKSDFPKYENQMNQWARTVWFDTESDS